MVEERAQEGGASSLVGLTPEKAYVINRGVLVELDAGLRALLPSIYGSLRVFHASLHVSMHSQARVGLRGGRRPCCPVHRKTSAPQQDSYCQKHNPTQSSLLRGSAPVERWLEASTRFSRGVVREGACALQVILTRACSFVVLGASPRRRSLRRVSPIAFPEGVAKCGLRVVLRATYVAGWKHRWLHIRSSVVFLSTLDSVADTLEGQAATAHVAPSADAGARVRPAGLPIYRRWCAPPHRGNNAVVRRSGNIHRTRTTRPR